MDRPDRWTGLFHGAHTPDRWTGLLASFDPYKNFKFRVKWDGKYVAGISKVSALMEPTGGQAFSTQP